MPASAWELNFIANDAQFQRRVRDLMVKGGVAVMAESSVTIGHADRVNYAQSVLRGTTQQTTIDSVTFADPPASPLTHGQAALTNATLTSAADINQPEEGGYNITDADLEFAVNEMWNAMSGVQTG